MIKNIKLISNISLMKLLSLILLIFLDSPTLAILIIVRNSLFRKVRLDRLFLKMIFVKLSKILKVNKIDCNYPQISRLCPMILIQFKLNHSRLLRLKNRNLFFQNKIFRITTHLIS
jgi:hypothetical protein